MSSISVPIPASRTSTQNVSLVYLYLLRAAYLLLIVGLTTSVWPAMIGQKTWPLTLGPWRSVGNSMIATLPVLAIFGLRYPLRMLPLLIYEATWKTMWLMAVALPLWLRHAPVDDALAATIQACFVGVAFYLVIPWRYVFENFVRRAGDRWR